MYRVTVIQRLPGITVVRAETTDRMHVAETYTVEPMQAQRCEVFEIRSMWGRKARISKHARILRAAIEAAVRVQA